MFLSEIKMNIDTGIASNLIKRLVYLKSVYISPKPETTLFPF